MHAKDLMPIPRLLSARNLLVVFPHPDDAEIAAGGTIAFLVQQGATVTYLSATDGSLGTYDPSVEPQNLAEIRKKELEESARLLGVKEVLWLGLRDGFVPESHEIRGGIVRAIRAVKPDFVLTLDPWLPYEAHPDHRKVSMAAVEACMYAPFPHTYPEHLREGLEPWTVKGVALALSTAPNTYVNVSTTWELKMQAIRCHRSQFPEAVWNQTAPYIRLKAQEYGKEIRARYAEPFKVLSINHLHVNPDAWRS